MGNNIIEIKKDWVQKIVKNLEDQIVQAILEMGDEAHATFSLEPYSLGYLFGFCSGGFEFHHIDRDLEKRVEIGPTLRYFTFFTFLGVLPK